MYLKFSIFSKIGCSDKNCIKCKEKLVCLLCNSEFYLTQEGQCKNNCPDQFYSGLEN